MHLNTGDTHRPCATFVFISVMAASDLPHIPSNHTQLYYQAVEIVDIARVDFEMKKKRKSDILLEVVSRKYGAKVRIVLYSPSYCHCEDRKCPEGKYVLLDTIIRIKCDEDIYFLKLFIGKQLQIIDCKSSLNDGTSDSE